MWPCWHLNFKLLASTTSWALKNWCLELWCWRRLLRVPWTARRSNQSILEEISRGCPLEGLMLELKLQFFSHLMRRADSFEKTLMLGKIEGRRRRGWQRLRGLDNITDSMDMDLGGLWELVMGQRGLECCGSWGRKELDMTERLNWTEHPELERINLCYFKPCLPSVPNPITDKYLEKHPPSFCLRNKVL